MTTTTVQTDTQLASRLRLAVMRLARILRQKAQDQITPSQLSALVSVERDGPVTLGELAALESVQPPTMTRIVVALEEQGLVLREADPADRRIARVHVTTAGRKLLERNRSRKTAYLASRMRGLSAEELEVLERAAGLLERMTADER
ncbi:MAG: MarR family transcriptional regulator [Actinobacteria bacterium]|nr:MAG: MarR family transcriptional regulator [Actinomycetota bacterium]